MSSAFWLKIFPFGLFVSTSYSVAVENSFQQKAIEPTASGQIGINPVTDFGPYSQYIPPIGPHSDVLVVQDGQTQWKWPNPNYFTEVPVTTTIDNEVKTMISPVQISASKATATADGVNPGDVTIVISPALKIELENFAVDVAAECKLGAKMKRANVAAAPLAVLQCVTSQAIKAAQPGGQLAPALEGAGLEETAAAAEVPASVVELIGGLFDVLVAAGQIAKNQLRLRSIWILSVILQTYTWTGLILYLYRLPSQPSDIAQTIKPSATPTGCAPGAPTGVNAPICLDESCQGLTESGQCSLGKWEGCDCLDTLVIDGTAQIVDPAWFELQQEILGEVMSAADEGVECIVNGGFKLFDGSNSTEPPEYCVCSELYRVPYTLGAYYPTIPSTSAPCAYTTLPASQIAITHLKTTLPYESVTSCRSHTATTNNEVYTSCTCNNEKGYNYQIPTTDPTTTITEEGCDYLVREAETVRASMSASTVPAPTPTNKNPPAQSVNLGILYCFPDHTSERATWYMSSDTVSNAIEQECEKWDSMASPWKVGPGATDQYSFTINVPDPSAGGTSTNVHFVIRSSKNDGCPVLDIGGTDKSPLCKDIFANSIVNNCDHDQDGESFKKQGGRFERDCLTWSIARGCDVAMNPDCAFN